MPKDFESFLKDEKNQADYTPKQASLDPNSTVNPYQQAEILEFRERTFATALGFNALSALAVAPFTVISASLQMSVLPHKNKYGDLTPEAQLKALVKTTKEITPSEKRKYELLLRSGVTGSNQPFRAPVYSGYYEVIKALANQGVLGFFKGWASGSLHMITSSQFRFQAMNFYESEYLRQYHKSDAIARAVTMFSLTTVVDMICNPLMVLQSRMILQNRLPNFRTYPGWGSFFKKHFRFRPKELYAGTNAYLYKNLTLLLAHPLSTYGQNAKQQMILQTYASFVLMYPWLTIIRRLNCQSALPGMIPYRYTGPIHALRLIAQEEGIRGLYRGFASFLVAGTIQSAFLMFITVTGQEDFLI